MTRSTGWIVLPIDGEPVGGHGIPVSQLNAENDG
jgi:hypothetical protein